MRILPLFLIFLLNRVEAQTLVMNGGFEDENICTEFRHNCAPEGWMSSSFQGDYYFDDAPHALEGTHFTALAFFNTRYRTRPALIRTRLVCSLRKDAIYLLTFYVRSTHGGLDSVGVSFTESDPLANRDPAKAFHPQMISGSQAEASGSSWVQLNFKYRATGKENFLTIGDAHTKIPVLQGRPDLGGNYYFFLDRVDLIPADASEQLCAGADAIIREAYETNERHALLEKALYKAYKNPQPLTAATPTRRVLADTLLIPDVFFATDKYELSSRALQLLDSFALASKNKSVDSLVIEGHTDSTGGVEHNRVLSKRRAESVSSYLEKAFSTPVTVRGWGSERPVADNKTAEGRRRNRRVEIYLYRSS